MFHIFFVSLGWLGGRLIEEALVIFLTKFFIYPIVYHKYSSYVSTVRMRDMIKLNTILILKGKTQKGKSRINEHGTLWKVTMIKNDKGVMRLESLGDTFKFNCEWRKDERWVSVNIVRGDENFELVGIEN